jgi:hypothetical protein
VDLRVLPKPVVPVAVRLKEDGVNRHRSKPSSTPERNLIMTLQVIAAVYGALVDGNPEKGEASNVTSTLQSLLAKSTTVAIDNASFGDPAPGCSKHFGALVNVDGDVKAFAGAENQSIDFA